MRPLSPSIPEKDFFFDALGQGLRIDGRALLEARKPEFVFGPDFGYVECSLGKTKCGACISIQLISSSQVPSRRVVASIDAKMVRPQPERQFEGMISLHCEISPMASTEFENGR